MQTAPSSYQSTKTLWRILVAFFVVCIIATGFQFQFYLNNRTTNDVIALFMTVGTAVLTGLGVVFVMRKRPFIATILGLAGLIYGLSIAAFIISGLGAVLGMMAVTIGSGIAMHGLPDKWRFRAIGLMIVFAIGLVLYDFFVPPSIYSQPTQGLFAQVLGVGLIVLVILASILQFKTFTLRNKVLTMLLASALIPMVIVMVIALLFILRTVQGQAETNLKNGASETAQELENFISTTQDYLATSATIPQLVEFVKLDPAQRETSQALRDTQILLNTSVQNQYRQSAGYSIVDATGTTIYDSNPTNKTLNRANEPYFRQVVQSGRPFVSPVLFEANNQPTLYFSQPIRDATDSVIGVLVLNFDAKILQDISQRTAGIAGENSFPLIIDEHNLVLADAGEEQPTYQLLEPLTAEKQQQLTSEQRLPTNVTTEPASSELITALNQNTINTVIHAPVSIGHEHGSGQDYYVLSNVPNTAWKVMYHQNETIFLAPVQTLRQRIVLIAIGILLSTLFAALMIARFFTEPINRLISATQRFTAGDLSTQADIRSQDEIGVLARSFNTMTDQLRTTLTGLEQRSRAIETSSQVSRRLSNILDPQQLAVEVVEQLQSAFNYYHAHIYLLNDVGDTLKMVGGTGRAGRTMLANNHQIPIGKGLVGRAATSKQTVLVPDVSQETGWLPNPLLPDTKAEIAVPIMLGETVLGVLDVQQNTVNGLDQEDATLIRTIADQVAIGLENARSVARITAQQELLQMRDRAITASTDGIIIVDPNQFDMPVIYANKAFEEITGYRAEEVIGKNLRFLHSDDTDQPGLRELRQGIREKRPTTVLLRNYRKDGTMYWNELNITPVFDESGKLVNFIGVQQDVTERVETQAQLQEISQLQGAVLSSASYMLIATDPEGTITVFNNAAEQYLGYKAEDMIGKQTPAIFHDGSEVIAYADELSKEFGYTILPGFEVFVHRSRNGDVDTKEWTYIAKDGRRFPVALSVTALRDVQGQITGFLGIADDITDRKQAEIEREQLLAQTQQQQRTLQTILDNLPVAVTSTDLKGVPLLRNRKAVEMYNINKENLSTETYGQQFQFHYVNSDEVMPAHEMPVAQTMHTLQPSAGEFDIVFTNGQRVSVEAIVTTITDNNNVVTGTLAILQDVTERKQAEIEREQLLGQTQQQQRTLQTILDNLPVGLTATDRRGTMLIRNRVAEDMFSLRNTGINMENYEQQLQFFHINSDQEFPQQELPLVQTLKTAQPARDQFDLVFADGSRTSIDAVATPITDANNVMTGAITIFQDITEQIQSEHERELLLAQTQQQQRTLQTILDNLPVGLTATDLQGQPIMQNPLSSKMFSINDPNVTVENFTDYFKFYYVNSDEVIPAHELPIVRSMQTQQLVTGQFDLVAADGTRSSVDATVTPLTDQNNNPIGTLSIYQDITERIQNENERERLLTQTQQQERTLQTILDNLPVGVFATDLQGTPQLVNKAAQAMLMVNADDSANPDNYGEIFNLYESDSDKLLPPEQLPLPITLQTGEISRRELDIHPPSGERINIDAMSVPLFNNQNTMTGALVLFQNITERKVHEKEREQLIEQVQERAIALEAVAEVSTAATSILESEKLLQTVVDLTKQTFRLYHAHIYLYNQAEQTLDLHVGAGEIGRTMVKEGRRIPYDRPQSLVAQSARRLKPVVENDTASNASFLSHPLLPNTRAEMAVPLVVGDKLLGVLDVQSDHVGAFTFEDQQIYLTLGGQVAIAVQNARLYNEQAATVARLEELDHLKSAFLANMSHELRTPLNSILGFTEVILEGINGPINDLVSNDLQIIHRNGRHLLNLINDILDMSKIESGKLTLFHESFDLYDTIHEVVTTIEPLAKQKNITLKADDTIHKGLPITADRFRIRQVLLNIVGNAVKFTEQGGVNIHVDSDDTMRSVIIRDTGIGIPSANLETIFMEFHQVDNSTTRKAGGTGLGLPISRHLVEMHGGLLKVESSGIAGEGSVFTITLPIDAEHMTTDIHDIPEPIHNTSIE